MAQNNIIASQLAPFIPNVQNTYTRNYIDDIVKEHTFDYGGRTLLIDEGGKVLIDSFDSMVDSTVSNVEIQRAFNNGSASKLYQHGNDYVIYSAVPLIEDNEIIGVSFMTINANDTILSVDRIIERLMIIYSVSIVISMVISLFFSEIIATPIEKLTESVKSITLGNYETRVEVEGNDEIAELTQSFNLMSTQLYQVDDRRKKFVSNVSHELRTPMTSMKIVSETLLSKEHWDEPVYREFLGDINSEVERLNHIIDSLLYLVRIEKEELELDMSITYVNYLIEKVIKTIKPIAHKKQIEVSFISDNRIQINLDQEKMQQCLLNIVGNAVKYTPENGKVWIELIDGKDNIHINVNDNGIGIPEKDIPYIFDRFYRVDEARTRKTGGTGLGLSIAQQIVQLHQGLIAVSANNTGGTSVSIQLPKI